VQNETRLLSGLKNVEREMQHSFVLETPAKRKLKKRSQKSAKELESIVVMKRVVGPESCESPFELSKLQKKRSRKAEESASIESSFLEEATIQKKKSKVAAVALEPSKHSKIRLGAAQIQDLQSTAKNLIQSFQSIELVSSSDDTESILSIDDNENAEDVQFEPSTLVWAPIKGFPMWPSKVVDPNAVGISKKLLKAGKEGQILIFLFGKHKFIWHSKSQLKLFCENEKGLRRTKNFRKAFCEAKDDLKNMNASSQEMNASLAVQAPLKIASNPPLDSLAAEADGKKRKKTILKAGKGKQRKQMKAPTKTFSISISEDNVQNKLKPEQLDVRSQRNEMRAKTKKMQAKEATSNAAKSTVASAHDEATQAFVVKALILLMCVVFSRIGTERHARSCVEQAQDNSAQI